MTSTPPITRYIGTTERTLQALLQQQLDRIEFTFPEWTVMTFLAGAGDLEQDDVVALLRKGQIAQGEQAHALLRAMIDRGLIAKHGDKLTVTEEGKKLFGPIRASVNEITSHLLDGLPAPDLEATRRTLEAVTNRAAKLLASGTEAVR